MVLLPFLYHKLKLKNTLTLPHRGWSILYLKEVNMYKIGEFSRITKMSIKALRYYDKEGILVPAEREDESAYRLYDSNSYERAMLIKKLRDFQFSISEIKDVIDLCNNETDLQYILNEKKEHIQREIDIKEKLIKKISDAIEDNNKEMNIMMNYDITIKEIPEIIVASIRYKDRYENCGSYIGKLYKALKGNASGGCINLYYDKEYAEIADIESCIPVKKAINDPKISCRRLPKIKAISTIHKGSYESSSHAYKALIDYARQHHLETTTPTREIHIKGPGMIFKGNPNKYITEIIMPIVD